VPQKIFITRDEKAVFSCPECGKSRQMDVSKFSIVDKEVKLKCTCTCKHVFSITLERRKYIRKEVYLSGVLILGNKKYPINVIDISKFGLKIRTKGLLDLHLEDRVVLEFALDDPDRSKVSKEATIKKIDQTNIGVEFLSHEHYDKFGHYLLFYFN